MYPSAATTLHWWQVLLKLKLKLKGTPRHQDATWHPSRVRPRTQQSLLSTQNEGSLTVGYVPVHVRVRTSAPSPPKPLLRLGRTERCAHCRTPRTRRAGEPSNSRTEKAAIRSQRRLCTVYDHPGIWDRARVPISRRTPHRHIVCYGGRAWSMLARVPGPGYWVLNVR